MAPLFEIFLKTGVWLGILAALTWIAYARLTDTADQAERWVKALSEPWLLKVAIGLGLLCWIWSFGLVIWDDAYLRGAGGFTELSTVLLVVILALAGVAWWRRRPATRFHPWISLAIALILILSPGQLLIDAPKEALSQETRNEESAVRFVRGRLVHLGCYGAADEPVPRGDSFDALTASAVVAFQLANGFLKDQKVDIPGVVQRDELRLLARPFPFLLGPKPCPPGKRRS